MISKTRLVDYKLAKMMGVDEMVEEQPEFINADYKEVNKEENKDDYDTDYTVF